MKRFPHLENLNIDFTKVTDKGLASLESVSTLRRLRAQSSTGDERGEESPREAIPDIRIITSD